MRLISLSMLKPDMVLAKSLYHRDKLILKEGCDDLDKHANALKNLGFDYVYVEDHISQGIEIPDAISEETRVSCKRILRQTIDDFENKTVVDLSDLSETIHNIIDDILSNEEMQVSLNDISASDEYTFAHSVSTTVYSLLIARQLGYSKIMLEKLAAGALFHDIGKILIDKKILNKVENLEPDEAEYIKQHTTLGYGVLKKCLNLTELSRIVALYHHEAMDGSGYPTGIKAGELNEVVRIVTVADTYDALVSDRCYRQRWNSNQAVNYLIEHAETKYDTKLVSAFIRQIAIYPNGSIIRLSDNCTGIVKEQNKNFPLRPVIRVIADANENEVEAYEIDLMKILSITIIESEIESNFIKY
jgi:putative nucleotidyltransferase with HDIG domain